MRNFIQFGIRNAEFGIRILILSIEKGTEIMLCLSGKELQEYINEEISMNWKKRDFLSVLSQYYISSCRRVLGISGLRGTGKTVGILQSLIGQDALYLCSQKGESETVQDYLRILKETSQKIIAIDEYTWIKEKGDLDAYLYTLVQNGKRVVITGTESISIDFLRYGELIHRIDIVNVNRFSYDEFCRMTDMDKNKLSCEKYLRTAGVFPKYIINNFETMKNYIKTAIIDNLTAYKPDMTSEYAAAIIYTILHKAVCDATVTSVPQIVEERLTIEDFLDEVGIDSSVSISKRDFNEISSLLEMAGVIVTVSNYRIPTEYRTYIVNPALTYQMILATHNMSQMPVRFERSLYGYMYEASCVVHAAYNLIDDGYGQDKLYYLHKRKERKESEIDFLITNESRKAEVYLFECKLNDGPVVKETSSIVSSFTEEVFGDKDIAGRYVVYNGPRNYDKVNGKEILYVGMDSLLSNYYSFSANKATILEEIKENGRKSYFEEKDERPIPISNSEFGIRNAELGY